MTEWNRTVDLLVIGSGGGGFAAALAAREAGLEALIVEKQALVGGATAMSGGVLWVPNNALMREEGVPDSVEQALAYIQSVLGDPTPPSSAARRLAYVTAGNEVVDMLRRKGIEFVRADGFSDFHADVTGGHTRGRSIESQPWDGNQLGEWRTKVMPGMASHFGLVVKTNELRLMQYFNRSLKSLATAVRVGWRTVFSRLRGRHVLTNGAALVGQLLRLALDEKIPVWLNAPVQGLIVEDGRVVGARIDHDGTTVTVRARAGVVLAAGGFSHNAAMRHRYGGDRANDGQWSMANPGDTGEVLEMAIELGAETDLLDVAWWMPSTRTELAASSLGQARSRPGGILVDQNGRRFVDEAAAMTEIADAMYAGGAVPCWVIIDHAYRKRYASGMSLPGHMPQEWFDNGWVKTADSIEALAAQIGVAPAVLADTIARFNTNAEHGLDLDFGRGVSAYDRALGDPGHKPNPALGPLAKAPFYAAQIFPADVGTGGGLLTDEHARVLGADGAPLPGLYATGNITATVLGRDYFGSGASISYTMAFGYLAGRHAARGNKITGTAMPSQRTA